MYENLAEVEGTVLYDMDADNSHYSKDMNKLLIDFNGPSQTQLEAVNSSLLIPLVPSSLGPANCPKNTSICSQNILDGDNDSDVENNPFDLVVHQTNLNLRMLNDPFELVYQKAYYLQTDTFCEVQDGSAPAHVTNTSITEVCTIPLPIKTVTTLQDTGNTTTDNNLNDSIDEFCGEDSLICIEDITDPTGCMYLSLSGTSDALKQSSAIERRNESKILNITNERNVHQSVKDRNGIFESELVEVVQGIGEDNSFLNVRPSLCSGCNEKGNCVSAGCVRSKAETHVLPQCQRITANSNYHTDEELKAIVMNRISACIQNALGQSKLSTRENDISNPILSSDMTSCNTGEKMIVPHTYSSHKHLHSLSFTSPAVKKIGIPAPQIVDTNISVEAFQMMSQQRKANSVNTGVASGLKTPLDSLKVSTQRGDSSTGSADSYGEMNKAFYKNALSPLTMDIPLDHLCDGSFSFGAGVSDAGAPQFPSVSDSLEKYCSLKCTDDGPELKENTAFNCCGNELCSGLCKHMTVRANGRNTETAMKINGMCDEQTVSSARQDSVQKENAYQRKCEYMKLFHEKSMDIDRNTSTRSTSDINDNVAGKGCVRRAMSSSWCAGLSNGNKNEEELDEDDSVFMEANTLAFVFSKVADSFTQLNSSDGEEDILNCRPQWEESQLNLPKFNSEDDDNNQVEENSFQIGAETKKYGGEINHKAVSPGSDMTPYHRYGHKKSSAQKKFDVNKKRGYSSTSSESPASSHSSKWSSDSCSGTSMPPLSKRGIQGLSLNARILPSADKKLNRAVPNVTLPPPLSFMDDKAEKDMRLKPKRKQEVGKRGPLKAVVPVNNMTRASGIQKKVVQAASHMPKSNSADVRTSTPKSLVKPLLTHETEANSTPITKKTGNPTAVSVLGSKTMFAKKDSFRINRSFTALSSPTSAPVLRRSNSLTSGITSLAFPPATVPNRPSCLNNDIHINYKDNSKSLLNVQPPSPICKQSSHHILTPTSQDKSKTSSSIPQFSLSGLAVTSTPTRKVRYTSPNCGTLKFLPSPIPGRDAKEKTSPHTRPSESMKTVAMPANKSVDSIQQRDETKSVSRHHGRSKSVSIIQPQKEKQTAQVGNHCEKPTVFGKGAKKDYSNSLSFQMGTPKPVAMKNRNQRAASKGTPKTDVASLPSGNDHKGPQSIVQDLHPQRSSHPRRILAICLGLPLHLEDEGTAFLSTSETTYPLPASHPGRPGSSQTLLLEPQISD